jgi:hypothetical protein
VDSLEKVLEKLATTEKTTIIAREVGGKIRVTSGSWDGEKVILKDEVLEVRNVERAAVRRPKGKEARRMGPADRGVHPRDRHVLRFARPNRIPKGKRDGALTIRKCLI